MRSYPRNHIVAIFLCLLATSSFAQKETRQTEAEELQGLVDDILKGTHQQVTRASITALAYLIDGSSQEDLSEALFSDNPSTVFILERKRKIPVHRVTISRDSNAALVTAITTEEDGRLPRIHTVFLAKAIEGNWMICNWHTSN
jgi:hypothetical protein